MNDYLVLMHDDGSDGTEAQWGEYLGILRASGAFSGGSAIGAGACVRKVGEPRPVSSQLTGYLRFQAASIEEVKRLLVGNPVFEGGGTIEIRELPRD